MSGPWERYGGASSQEDAPWKRYAASAPKQTRPKGALGKVDAAMRGAADFLVAGWADELAAGAEALPALAQGRSAFNQAYRERVQAQRERDAADKRDLPVSRATGQVGGLAASLGTGAVLNLGRAVPRLAQAGAARVAESVARSAGAGALYGGVAGAGNAEGSAFDRASAAAGGAALGAIVGGAAVPITGLIGAGANAFLRSRAGPTARGAEALRSRVPDLDVPAMRAEANAFRQAGVEPSLIHVLPESGKGLARAAASRQTPAREAVQRAADTAALNLPDRMSQQARRTISADPRTPMEIAQEVGERRATEAARDFGAVRGDVIEMAPETVTALRTDHGRQAIAEAARRERDPTVRAALNRLANDALDDPSTPITVGMADRISRTLNGRADAAARAGDNDLASLLSGLSRDVRGPAREGSEGYRRALEGYAAQSRVLGAAERGEDFLRRNTDEFVADVANLPPAERAVARATARRAVERASGENTGSARGVARRLANAPEQQARNRALLGSEANAFEEAMRREERFVGDLVDMAPKTGSQTQLRTQDAQRAAVVADAVGAVVGGPPGIVSAALNRMKTLGLSDRDAEAIARLAIDQGRLDRALNVLSARLPPNEVMGLAAMLRQAGSRNAGEASAPVPAY